MGRCPQGSEAAIDSASLRLWIVAGVGKSYDCAMPDWSYITLVQPVLSRLPDDWARRFINGWFSALTRIPGGHSLVDLLGAMLPAPDVAATLPDGSSLASNLVMTNCIDPRGQAARAFGRFGFGALVFGPVGIGDVNEPHFERGQAGEVVAQRGPLLSLNDAKKGPLRLEPAACFFELDALDQDDPLAAIDELMAGLGEQAAGAILSPQCWSRFEAMDTDSQDQLVARFVAACTSFSCQPFFGLPCNVEKQALRNLYARYKDQGLAFYLAGSARAELWQWGGSSDHADALERLALIRELGPAFVLVAAGSASPRQALELEQGGADLVGLGSGMVAGGPGLARRINEARSYFGMSEQANRSDQTDGPHVSWERLAWSWGVVLGLALLLGALLAGWSALTHVLLPYDEAFLGKTAAELKRFNPRILMFMTHDRITLAGTMVSLGVLYLTLSWFAMRWGERWAQVVVALSSSIGFFSFFAFLGFGYLDPFHAFVTLALAQVTTQVVVRPIPTRQRLRTCPRLDNDKAWRAKLWGQFLFLFHGVALLLAGGTILAFGMSVVFVPQDIDYLGMNVEQIAAFDSQLRALIAHDRATFGGMLLCAGTALCLTSMWSFRQGQRWLFWTLVLIIFTPYVMTLWVHFSIGYHDHFHLTPVYIGLALLALAAICSAPVLLCREQPERPSPA